METTRKRLQTWRQEPGVKIKKQMQIKKPQKGVQGRRNVLKAILGKQNRMAEAKMKEAKRGKKRKARMKRAKFNKQSRFYACSKRNKEKEEEEVADNKRYVDSAKYRSRGVQMRDNLSQLNQENGSIKANKKRYIKEVMKKWKAKMGKDDIEIRKEKNRIAQEIDGGGGGNESWEGSKEEKNLKQSSFTHKEQEGGRKGGKFSERSGGKEEDGGKGPCERRGGKGGKGGGDGGEKRESGRGNGEGGGRKGKGGKEEGREKGRFRIKKVSNAFC